MEKVGNYYFKNKNKQILFNILHIVTWHPKAQIVKSE
jgi:hypothetical protein